MTRMADGSEYALKAVNGTAVASGAARDEMVDKAVVAEFSDEVWKRGGRQHGGKEDDVGQLAHVADIKTSSLNFFRRRLYFKNTFLGPLVRKKRPHPRGFGARGTGPGFWSLVQLDLRGRVAAETVLAAAAADDSDETSSDDTNCSKSF